MPDLRKRLSELDDSLSAFDAGANPSWQMGEIFNALLAEAKKSCPDDPIIRAISPAAQQRIPIGIDIFGEPPTDAHAGSLRAAVKQMLVALAARTA